MLHADRCHNTFCIRLIVAHFLKFAKPVRRFDTISEYLLETILLCVNFKYCIGIALFCSSQSSELRRRRPIKAIYVCKFKQNISQYQYQLIYESATNLVAIMRHKHVYMYVRCVFCIN